MAYKPQDDQVSVRLLEDIAKYTRFLAVHQAQSIAATSLGTDKKRQVYNLTDGEKSVREIAELAKVNRTTISNWWREWHSVGLVDAMPGTHGTRRATFSLEELGYQEASNGD